MKKEKMVMPARDLTYSRSEIMAMMYHFLREAPGWKGYSIPEATKMIAHRLKKKNIPFQVFIEFSEAADKELGQSLPIIQQVIQDPKTAEIF